MSVGGGVCRVGGRTEIAVAVFLLLSTCFTNDTGHLSVAKFVRGGAGCMVLEAVATALEKLNMKGWVQSLLRTN